MNDLKVTARAVALFEKETGKTIQDVMDQIAGGKLPSVETIAIMIKAASNKNIDQAYEYIDANQHAYMGTITAYSEWVKTAFAVADSGNLEASTTAAN